MKRLLHILAGEQAATVVEYAVLLGLIALVLLSSVALVGQQTNGMWSSIQTNLTQGGALR